MRKPGSNFGQNQPVTNGRFRVGYRKPGGRPLCGIDSALFLGARTQRKERARKDNVGMGANSKIHSAIEIATSRGIGRLDAVPPLHRLIWALGIQARPPHFASFGVNTLLFGGFWGVCMEGVILSIALVGHPDMPARALVAPMAMVALIAIVFGCLLARVFRSRARAAALPDWEALIG